MKSDENNHFAVFEISDDNFCDFYSLIDLSFFEVHDVEKLMAIGEDGGLYSLNREGIVKEAAKSHISAKANWKRLKKTAKQIENDIHYCTRIKEKYGTQVSYLSKSPLGYDKYVFVDESNNLVIPFRFHKSNRDNRPLVLYFSGGGTLGHDNIKTLNEFLFYAGGNNLVKKDCNVLIPQGMFSEAESEKNSIEMFTDSCSKIVRILLSENHIDDRRVYTYGTSLGGKCVWRALLGNTDLYAAAVEAMGMIHNYREIDFQKIKHIPIWLAHSSDDNIVKIESDDYCYDKLNSLGADVKYTRWDKYGHSMATKFYKNEEWMQWLLSKTR